MLFMSLELPSLSSIFCDVWHFGLPLAWCCYEISPVLNSKFSAERGIMLKTSSSGFIVQKVFISFESTFSFNKCYSVICWFLLIK